MCPVAAFKNYESGDSCLYSILTISRHLSNSGNLALNSDACNLETFKADFPGIFTTLSAN